MVFGGLTAIDGLSFRARAGEITALIGPNGAGKTTVFNCLTGFYRPTSGRLALRRPDGREVLLERLESHRVAREGRVARTFQNVRLFPRMTALENLLVAQHAPLMRGSGWTAGGILGLPAYARARARAVDRAAAALERVGLLARADDEAGSLPYGAQRRLEIARAVCADPLLLCLDEPAAGLNPSESDELGALLSSLRDDDGMSMLLIEHDMSVVMGISDRVHVLDYGRLIFEGAPAEAAADPRVIAAYLGEEEPGEGPGT